MVAAGTSAYVGIPAFVSRLFRHSGIYVRADAGIATPADLKGKRIGLAVWQDSGNTWTRALLRHDRIGIEDAQWRISRIAASDPIIDRFHRGVIAKLSRFPMV